ncbi:MAG TPA: glycosyltransferase [Acidimicrobiales bacterium]|nr:glycosyltransferase [Acidimicrobiales bacterium]
MATTEPVTSSAADEVLPDSVRVHVASANTKPVTELCVRSIHRTAGHPFGLVVGDVGSGDGSLPMLRRLETDGWLRLEVAPSWRQHHEWLDRWVAQCPARYAVFVDSDVCFVTEGWLSELVAAARSTNAALVCAQLHQEETGFVHPGSGEVMRLAARPCAHLLLVDTAQVAGIDASFAPVVVPSSDVPEGYVSYDVAALFFGELDRAGLGWIEMPAGFSATFRHFGGMSWRTRKLWPDLWPGWSQARTLTKIRAAVAWHRLRWGSPSPWYSPPAGASSVPGVVGSRSS